MVYLFIFILFIILIWILLWFLHITKKVISPTQEFLLKTFVATLTIIGTIIASAITTTNQISEQFIDFKASLSNQLIQTINIPAAGNLSELSVEEKLLQAEQAFNAGKYQDMMQIYSFTDTSTSAIRNNNYGYAYANGLYVEKSLETAEIYFDKAISAGLEEGFANKFRALMCQNKLSEAAELLLCWYQNPKHKILEAYFKNNVTDKNSVTLEDFCHTLSPEDRCDLLKNLVTNEYLGYTSSEYPLIDAQIGGYFYDYQYVSHKTQLHQADTSSTDQYISVTTYTYKVYKQNIVNSDLLNLFATIESQLHTDQNV